jgi:hypothetical protein
MSALFDYDSEATLTHSFKTLISNLSPTLTIGRDKFIVLTSDFSRLMMIRRNRFDLDHGIATNLLVAVL